VPVLPVFIPGASCGRLLALRRAVPIGGEEQRAAHG
jgi:hypothetical protein